MEYKKPIAIALVGTLVANANVSIFLGELSTDLPPMASVANFAASTGSTYVSSYAPIIYNTVTDERIDMLVPKSLFTRF